MQPKTLKSIRTLASDLKAKRKRKLAPEQIYRLNKIFEEIEKKQQKDAYELKNKDQCDNF